MNRTDRNRLQRLEAKAGTKASPRIVIVMTGLHGGPEHATCNGETIEPESGEALTDFEARAEQNFEADQVLTITFPGNENAI